MKFLISSTLLALLTLPAAAQDGYGGGGYGDWSGPYVSGAIGFGRTASSSDAAGPTVSVSEISGGYALAVGHQIQQGSLVYGGEASVFDVRGDLGAVGAGLGVDYGLRLAARVGYDLGQTLAYGTLGVARIDFDGAGFDQSENAVALGAGIDRRINDQLSIGAEYVYYRFGEVDRAGGAGQPADVDVGTLNLKLSYGF